MNLLKQMENSIDCPYHKGQDQKGAEKVPESETAARSSRCTAVRYDQILLCRACKYRSSAYQ